MTLFCDFCAKSQHDVVKLIVGPADRGICNGCVALCASICISEAEQRGLGTVWLSRAKPLSGDELIHKSVRVVREQDAASGTDARSGETACGLDPKDDGPAAASRDAEPSPEQS